MSPTSLYYLLLYILVIVINYFRVRKRYQIPDENTPNPQKFDWRPVLYVSLDFVYTSAGFVILIIQNKLVWAPAILILYLILVTYSSNLDSIGDRLGENFKLWSHIIIGLIIVCFTLVTFNTSCIINNKHKYRIAIPYLDKTLMNRFPSDRTGETLLVYIHEVECISKNEAIKSALNALKSDKQPLSLIINEKDIIVEEKAIEND